MCTCVSNPYKYIYLIHTQSPSVSTLFLLVLLPRAHRLREKYTHIFSAYISKLLIASAI